MSSFGLKCEICRCHGNVATAGEPPPSCWWVLWAKEQVQKKKKRKPGKREAACVCVFVCVHACIDAASVLCSPLSAFRIVSLLIRESCGALNRWPSLFPLNQGPGSAPGFTLDWSLPRQDSPPRWAWARPPRWAAQRSLIAFSPP